MRQLSIASLVVLLSAAQGYAGEVEKSLESRWRGAWVVLTVDTYSDCLGGYTGNRVNGNLVSSRSRRRFQAGELARVESVDAKRSRVDLKVTLAEPLLVSYQDGPFTLYNEARCGLELQVEVPRQLVSDRDTTGIETALKQVAQRYASQAEAQRSKGWNRRQRDPYPEDYEETLAEHAAWKASQVNAAVQARLDKAAEETSRLTDRLSSDPDYLKGFAAGVEQARAANLGQCADLLSRDLSSTPATPANQTPEQQRVSRGFQDGQRLVYGLELMRRLPKCFVPVPGPPGRAAQYGPRP